MTTQLPGQPIDVPLVPEFCEAIGYNGKARFVSFRWAYDDLFYDDGRSSGTAQGWTFQAFARHRAVAPLLDPHDLGSSDHEAPFVLLIDRERNRASIVPRADARAFLAGQHPPQEPLTPEQQAAFERELERLMKEWREKPVDHEAIARQMAEQRGRVGRMMSWLDQCPVPRRGPTP
jgi:hypothetical protein